MVKQPLWINISFQQGTRILIEQASYFHDFSLLVIRLILIIIGWIILDIIIGSVPLTSITEHTILEVWWTVLPRFVLVSLALPSLTLLYLIDEAGSPDISINILGHQWYWEYNYPDFNGVAFESYILTDYQSLLIRLIEVDNRVVVPYNCSTRALISRVDVLHSWTIPSIGVKADAAPGRLNQVSVIPWAVGLYYGQCSEICGANHRFIPIVLEVLRPNVFSKWVSLWIK